jgi:hypothetical protein
MHIKFNDFCTESKIVKVGDVSNEDGWEVLKLDSIESFNHVMDNFYQGRKWIHNENGYDIYYYESTVWDDKENEPFWYKKLAIAVNPKEYIIKTKNIEDKPIYSIRDEKNGMTMEQELKLRTWIGTEKNPKINKFKGEYLGMDGELAVMITPTSGNKYKLKPDGNFVEDENGSMVVFD